MIFVPEKEFTSWNDLAEIKKEHEDKQWRDQAEREERQEEMMRIIKARSKRSIEEDPLEIILNLNFMMGIDNPPGCFLTRLVWVTPPSISLLRMTM